MEKKINSCGLWGFNYYRKLNNEDDNDEELSGCILILYVSPVCQTTCIL